MKSIDNKSQYSRFSKKSEKTFYNIIDSLKEGIYICDLRGNLLFVNRAFVEILGYKSKNNLVGRNIGSDIYLNPNHRKVLMRHLKKFGYVKDYEIRLIKQGGDIITVGATVNLVQGDHDEIVAIEGIIHDVTERNAWEKELETLQGTLMFERHKLEQVLNIDQKISSILDINHLVDFVIEKATTILDAERCSLMILDTKTKELIIRGATGVEGEVIKKTRIKLGDGIAGYVAKKGNPFLVRDIENNPYFCRQNGATYRNKSFMIVPIKVHGKIIGVVNVADKRPHALGAKVFNEIDLKILTTIVRQAAIAIENAHYFSELQHLSISDPLTGLYNHRYFIKSLDAEIERIKRYPKELSLMMIDLDNFKDYNDLFGHLEGDLLLNEFSQVLQKSCRQVDTVCRYAGDEFIIILPETTANRAEIVAKKIVNNLQTIKTNRPVSISVGIARYCPPMDRRDLILKSDQALYEAKKNGRNQILIF